LGLSRERRRVWPVRTSWYSFSGRFLSLILSVARYLVLGDERKRKYCSIYPTSCCKQFPGRILLISMTARDKLARQNRRSQIDPASGRFAAGISSPLSN
jgi:hypothetical protein